MRALPPSVLPLDSRGYPLLDAVVLGLGPDGHCASLFPGHAALTAAAGRWVVGVPDAPKPPAGRITLSLEARPTVLCPSPLARVRCRAGDRGAASTQRRGRLARLLRHVTRC